jgi:hypothetical protein
VVPTGNISGTASNVTGTVALANGGTGQTSITGVKAALGLSGTTVAIGASSGTNNQGAGAVGIGNGTGQTNQGSQSIAIGYVAGSSNQGAYSVAIGSNAAQSGQGTQSVAIGIAANSAANNATALGGYATAAHTNATAIGFQAATTANNTIQLGADGVTVAGSTAITNVKTTGTITAGTVTYPNTHNSSAGQVLTVNASGTATWAAASGSSAHYVGEAYGGGIIFYVWDNGTHGLIVAPNELGNLGPANFTSTTGIIWGPNGSTGAFRSGLGGGEGNTDVMISKLNNSGTQWFTYSQSTTGMYSALCVQQYSSTYADWYLPSSQELQLLYANRNLITGSGYNNSHVYWSSTETNSDYAYTLQTNGGGSWSQKSALHYVLPVRKF